MADLAFFCGGAMVGFAVGLVCRKNNIKVLPDSIDMGPFSHESHYKAQYEIMLDREKDSEYMIKNGNRVRQRVV
jgi:hypothetical protein